MRMHLLKSAAQEGQQVLVTLVLVGIGQAVRRTRIHFQEGVGHQLLRSSPRRVDRDDLVVIAMDDQCWLVEFLKVFGEVGFGKRLDRVEGILEPACHALHPPSVNHALGGLSALQGHPGRAVLRVQPLGR